MNYYEQEGHAFNNQTPWETDDLEIVFVLAENGVRRDANRRPYKCWIPTLMGPKQTPIPQIFKSILTDGIYCNDEECKVPVSNQIYTKNYIDVYGDDHTFFYHRWLDHGTEAWCRPENGDILDLEISSRVDYSYCDSCISQHPSCNTVHGCIN